MTACVLVAAVITCSDVRPLPPAQAAQIFVASVPSRVPPGPFAPGVIASYIAPLSNQWWRVTHYATRYGVRTVYNEPHLYDHQRRAFYPLRGRETSRRR